MTRTETEALRKPDALPYGIDSRNRIRSDSGSETVITFCIGTGRATRKVNVVAPRVPEGALRRFASCRQKGLRKRPKTKPHDSIGDKSFLLPATSKRKTTLWTSEIQTDHQNRTSSATSACRATRSVGRRIGRGKQPKPIQSRSMITDQ